MRRPFAPVWALICVLSMGGAARAAEDDANTLRFDVWAFNIVGNTKLSTAEVEQAVYPFLGPGKAFADISRAQAALEKAYQDRGLLSVVINLPQQSLNSGEITLEVIESRIDAVRVKGAQHHLPSRIREDLPSLRPGQVPDFNAMQQELAQAQSSGDLRITPEVKPQAEDPRRMDINLLVEDTLPVHGSIEANTKQSYNTKRGRIEAGISYGNLFQRGHDIGLNWIYSPWRPDEADTLSLSYALPLGLGSQRFGQDSLSFSAVHSNSSTPTVIGGATVSLGNTLGLRYRRPLPAYSAGLSHGWTVGLDYTDNKSANEKVGGFSTNRPDLRYPALNIGYDLVRSTDTSQTEFNARLVLGTTGLSGHTVDCDGERLDQFDCNRVGASPDFQALKLSVKHTRPVFGNWQLKLESRAQLASGPLASPEQISFGGLDSVRGYYESEQAGDQGVSLRAELGTPTLFTWGDVASTGFFFFDRAELAVIDPLPTELQRIHMGSFGLGLKLASPKGFAAQFNLAMPVFDTRKAESTGNSVASGRHANAKPRWDLYVRQSF